MKCIKYVMIVISIMITAGCGWHLKGQTQKPVNLRTLIMISDDPHGPLSRAVRKELRLNGIEVVDNMSTARMDLITLHLENDVKGEDPASVIGDRTAEKQLFISLSATVMVPGKDRISLTEKIYRSRFINAQGALLDASAQEVITREMYAQVAAKLVRRLILISNKI